MNGRHFLARLFQTSVFWQADEMSLCVSLSTNGAEDAGESPNPLFPSSTNLQGPTASSKGLASPLLSTKKGEQNLTRNNLVRLFLTGFTRLLHPGSDPGNIGT